VPATPAEVPLNTVTQDASPLIRQLEHRVRDLPALAQRLTTRRHSALSEADAARHALTQPLKYAAELEQAAATRAEITEEIKVRHEQAHDHDHDTTPDAAARQPEVIDAAQARRLAAVAFPSPAPRPITPGASTRDTSRLPGQTPTRRLPAAPETLTMRHRPVASRVG
jgi:hypothetical protein